MSDNGAAATLAMTQAVSAFTFFLPKITDVRKTSREDLDAVADIRVGEAAAFTVTLGIGAICASLSQSAMPIFVTLIIASIIIALYEAVLRADPGPEHRATVTLLRPTE